MLRENQRFIAFPPLFLQRAGMVRSNRLTCSASLPLLGRGLLPYLCGCVGKAEGARQGNHKVFVMERSNRAHNSGLHPKRRSLFWPSFLTCALLPKERPLELINSAQRLGLCTFSLWRSPSCYVFPHSLLSLGVNNIFTSSFTVKISFLCFSYRCIAFKLMFSNVYFKDSLLLCCIY